MMDTSVWETDPPREPMTLSPGKKRTTAFQIVNEASTNLLGKRSTNYILIQFHFAEIDLETINNLLKIERIEIAKTVLYLLN